MRIQPRPGRAPRRRLIPNAVYHVRLVATNINGTTVGAIRRSRPEGPEAARAGDRQELNVSVTSGVVFIKPPPGKSLGFSKAAFTKGHGFLPLTEAGRSRRAPRSTPGAAP